MAITREKVVKKYILELDGYEKDALLDYLQESIYQKEDFTATTFRENLIISLKNCIQERS